MFGVPQFIAQGPFWGIVAFLVVVVFFRAQSTYWLARAATEGFLYKTRANQRLSGKIHRWLEGASVKRGVHTIERFGLIIIPLSFFTWGFQTIVQAGAGVLRLRWWLYTLVALPGYVAWAFIYATAGITVWKAVLAALAGNIYAFAAIMVAFVALVVLVVFRRVQAGRKALAVGAVNA